MSELVKILLLEDNPADAELIKAEINRSGKNAEVLHVANKKSYLNALEQFKPDIILSDYSMPQFNGMEALSLLKYINQFIPFIIVTGSLNEEIAVECMKAGANDYVLKDFLGKLIPSIDAALEKSKIVKQREAALNELRASEQKFRTLTNTTNAAIFIYQGENFIYVNAASEKLSGYSQNELLTMKFWDIVHSDYKELIKSRAAARLSGKSVPPNYEFKIIRKNGEERWIDFSAGSIVFNNEPAVIGTAYDITERKLAEEELRTSKYFIERITSTIPLIIYIYDLKENRNVFANRNILETLGYSPQEISDMGTDMFKLLLHPEDLESYHVNTTRFNTAGENEILELEYRMKDKNGNFRWLHSWEVIFKRDDEGKPVQILGAVEDITKQKESFEKLLQSEERYSSQFRNNHAVMLIIEPQSGNIIDANPAASNFYGYTIAKLKQMKITQINTLSRDQLIIEMELARTQKRNHFFFKHKLADGTIKDVEVYSGPISILGYDYLYSIVHDITERRIAEEKLRKLSSAVEQSPISILITNKSGEIEYANPTLCEITGYSIDELIGQNPRMFKSGEIPKEDYKKLWDTIQFGKTWNGEFHNKRKDGTLFWESASISPIIDELGNITHFVAVKEDITEKKKHLEAIRETEESLRVLADATGVVLYKLRFDTMQYDYLHPSIEQLTGYSVEEINSIGFSNIVRSIHRFGKQSSDREEIVKERESGKLKEFIADYLIRTKSGEERWLGDRSYPWYDKAGKMIGSIGVLTDITERKKSERELIHAKDKAEEMNRLKTNFLNNMSHEIRTPMVGILGFAQLLREEITNVDQRKMIDEILLSGKRLMETINSILDLSRIESKKFDLLPSEFDLVEEVTSTLNSLTVVASQKKLYLNINAVKKNMAVYLDKRMLNQILNNLVGNAIKFTKEGGVTVNLATEKSGNKNYIIMDVADTGIGIPEEYQKIIFEEFRQVSEGLSRTFEGTGLGLTITKKLVDIMNGEIHLKSKVGEGSTFTVKIPVRKRISEFELKPQQKAETVEDLKGIKPLSKKNLPSLLLVENDEVNANITKIFLKDICLLDIAYDAESCLNMVKKKIYDSILMDIHLGLGMSGTEAVKEIRKLPAYKNTPVVAVTAYAMAGDREKFLEAGCTHYISKPFDKKGLIKVISEALKF